MSATQQDIYEPLNMPDSVMRYAEGLAYLKEPSKIRAACINNYGRSPSLEDIQAMVTRHENKRALPYTSYSDARLAYNPASDDGGLWHPGQRSDTHRAGILALKKLDATPVDYTKLGNLDKRSSAKKIAETVAENYGMTLADLQSNSRAGRFIAVRFLAVKIIRDVLNDKGEPRYSFTQIGRLMRRDHTTIQYAYRNYDVKLKTNPNMENVRRAIADALV